MKISLDRLRQLGFDVKITEQVDGAKTTYRLKLYRRGDAAEFVEMHCTKDGLARLDVILAHLAMRYSKDIKKTLEFGRTRLSILES